MSSAAESPQARLKNLRDGLTPGHRKIVREVIGAIEEELIDALPELQNGVNTSAAEGSFSTTLAIKKGKRGRFAGRLTARVRTPREPIELDFHVSDSGQLELGLPTGWGEGEGGEAGGE